MFRRRRTDHIYATLQSVQRRLTQGTESGSERVSGGQSSVRSGPVTPAAPAPTRNASRSTASALPTGIGSSGTSGLFIQPDGSRTPQANPHLPPGEATDPGDSQGSAQAAPPPAPTQPPDSTTSAASASTPPSRPMPSVTRGPGPLAGRRPGTERFGRSASEREGGGDDRQESGRRPPSGVHLSVETLGVLVAIWLLSLFGAYLAGGSGWITAGSGQEPPPPPPAYAGQGERSTVGDERSHQPAGTGTNVQGSHIVIIDSVRSGQEDQQRSIYQGYADKLNAHYADRGFNAAFGMRVPSSGGLQFVYGVINGRMGVQEAEAEAVWEEVSQPGRFPKAYVLDLGQ